MSRLTRKEIIDLALLGYIIYHANDKTKALVDKSTSMNKSKSEFLPVLYHCQEIFKITFWVGKNLSNQVHTPSAIDRRWGCG